MWDYCGIKNYILSKIDGNERLVLDINECNEIARTYNINYRGYKTDDHLLGNISGVIREALYDKYRVRCSYKNKQIIILPKESNNNEIEYSKDSNENNIDKIPLLPIDYNEFLPKNVPKYIDVNNLLKIFDIHMNMDDPIPLLLIGPKGIGKTLSIAYYAHKNNIPIIQYDCSEDTRRTDLIGKFVLVGERVYFEIGELPKAIELANIFGKAIIVFEEINTLSNYTQKILNQFLDWRKHVYVPEINKTYRCINSKLLVCATMNPTFYSGVNELNEDLRSRFCEIKINYPDMNSESNILRATTKLPSDIMKMIIRLANEIRNGVNSGELSYAISTRDLCMFASLYMNYIKYNKKEDALLYSLKHAIINRYDDYSEINTVKQRIKSIFGIET